LEFKNGNFAMALQVDFFAKNLINNELENNKQNKKKHILTYLAETNVCQTF
jgi:hypothetical protein